MADNETDYGEMLLQVKGAPTKRIVTLAGTVQNATAIGPGCPPLDPLLQGYAERLQQRFNAYHCSLIKGFTEAHHEEQKLAAAQAIIARETARQRAVGVGGSQCLQGQGQGQNLAVAAEGPRQQVNQRYTVQQQHNGPSDGQAQRSAGVGEGGGRAWGGQAFELSPRTPQGGSFGGFPAAVNPVMQHGAGGQVGSAAPGAHWYAIPGGAPAHSQYPQAGPTPPNTLMPSMAQRLAGHRPLTLQEQLAQYTFAAPPLAPPHGHAASPGNRPLRHAGLLDGLGGNPAFHQQAPPPSR